MQELNVSSLLNLLNWEHASVTSREALCGPEAAPSGPGGSVTWSSAMLGSADASGACHVAAYGRRRAHIAPSAHRKKNACNGRIYSRLSGRDHDISGLKSSFIPPVRLLEACGAHRRSLRTCRNSSVTPYVRRFRKLESATAREHVVTFHSTVHH